MIIGFFKDDGHNGWTGSISTLSFTCEADIRPTIKQGPGSPDYRVDHGAIEFGAAWKRKPKEDYGYPLVILNCPSFPKPVECTLVPTNKGWLLHWETTPLAKPE